MGARRQREHRDDAWVAAEGVRLSGLGPKPGTPAQQELTRGTFASWPKNREASTETLETDPAARCEGGLGSSAGKAASWRSPLSPWLFSWPLHFADPWPVDSLRVPCSSPRLSSSQSPAPARRPSPRGAELPAPIGRSVTRRKSPRSGAAPERATTTALRAGRRYLTHWTPPPDRALSAVGGGAVTPGPAA